MSVPEMKAEWKRIVSADGILLYEGYTFNNKPYGEGTSYYSNGNKYQEGRFGIKGLLSGKEYYPNGNLRFEGEFELNRAYGPNAPISGAFYDTEGKLVFQGKFQLQHSGLGYPTVVTPEEYGAIPQKDEPKNLDYLMWDDVRPFSSELQKWV